MGKQIALLIAASLLLFAAGCSHNPAIFTIGKQFKIGTTEYGEISYINGLAIVDCSRENSSWELEIDDEDGITFDKATNTIKGVRKIRRIIGKQVTGYLVDLAKVDKCIANEYVNEQEKPDASDESQR